MVPVWVVTTIFLRIWLIGLMAVIVLSVSDFVFRRPHHLGMLVKRVATGLVWPLALVTPAGRHALVTSFRTPRSSRSLTHH
jgi:hypothetical protein